ncbi:glycosyltransferase [Pseudomonas sp. GOM7]|uniref:glycosyltransferase n=1 Tax=unclassified Pseudomonas TaxID=196821 RepID=UPI00227CFA3F|nr:MULTISPECIES: glycosyltransferase [unclassified Pseudomonas]WAJ37310.1 glycosyltransferase [Pseudomonas sp. GOM7]
MRIALLAPLPPEQTGIADYAWHLSTALQAAGVEVLCPLRGCGMDAQRNAAALAAFDWSSVDLAHAELGGGRLGEFQALRWLQKHQPQLPLTATVHDPERLVWRRASLPWALRWLGRLPSPLPQLAALLADPLTLREERQVAQGLARVVTLTELGGGLLARRMRLPAGRQLSIAHGNLQIAPQPLPAAEPLRLLYFGFIYRGKGIEDLLDALAATLQRRPELHGRIRLTLAGGSAPEIAFGPRGNYLDELRARARALRLEGCLDWSLDLPASDIAACIQAHHVLVLPYRESKKLSLLGEMRGTSGALSWANACGRGAITSDARAFAEEVRGGNGLTYPQGNVEALSACIEQAAETPQRVAQWAERAAEIGAARAWPKTAERFRQLFAEVCA